jgi:phage tail sheath protein FI
MAETLISPGVLAREQDQSQITSQPVQAGAAIIGPTVLGPVERPTLVTTFSEYLATFGGALQSGSDEYSYFTSISAFNYFQGGGTSLIVTRVVSGSYSAATSSFISGSNAPALAAGTAFTLETIGSGTIMNSTSTLTSKGALPSGSSNNVRWEITTPDTSSGTFTLLVRRGDDNTKSKRVLESYTNLSLDPKSSGYIARVIGDQTTTLLGSGTAEPYLQQSGNFPNASRYIRVKSVDKKTPDYLDNDGNAKSQYTASIPIASAGTFGDAEGGIKAGANFYDTINSTNTQGLVEANYTDAINLLANKDEFKYNIITVPGLVYVDYPTPLNSLIDNTATRGDAIVIADTVNYGASITNVISTAASIDSSYTATYWPWCQITDPSTGQLAWVPASTLIPGVYAANDASAETWFAPAGINRGGLGVVRQAERKLTQTNRDSLYVGKVNPIATFPGRGVVVFGQKTLQTRASALDRVNVRRLLISLKSFISQVADNLVFEQNTAATRNNFLGQVNPFLESVQQRQGLFAFKVVMDDSNNTPDVIDRNQLVGQIFVQPTKTAEFIYLDFNILPTGATFPA